MKYFDWDEKKNKLLKETRDISFEEIVLAISNNQILDILEHPDKAKFPNQKMFIVELFNYAFVVPFVEDEQKYFLKTIYPSRKATKQYLEQQ
ncbi:MAG: hypothetical protein SCALA702_00130 [Melioribacteraceae bacterium]|nr:MAG: hypothetical protein SCALA702_00130 [Melioribacteraceae bacterium]